MGKRTVYHVVSGGDDWSIRKKGLDAPAPPPQRRLRQLTARLSSPRILAALPRSRYTTKTAGSRANAPTVRTRASTRADL